ncbi:MAG: hypothetical protein LBM75_12030 [Myxococcales bacterium]|jgi:hypothetical protein|nr:hypothetical protein [Myxococcales bacterium]
MAIERHEQKNVSAQSMLENKQLESAPLIRCFNPPEESTIRRRPRSSFE